MKMAARLISLVALVATIAPAIMFMADGISLGAAQSWMLAATVAWFATAPLWMDD